MNSFLLYTVYGAVGGVLLFLFVAYVKAATMFTRRMRNEGNIAPSFVEAWRNRK